MFMFMLTFITEMILIEEVGTISHLVFTQSQERKQMNRIILVEAHCISPQTALALVLNLTWQHHEQHHSLV